MTSIELGDFLRKGNTGPEHQALTSLIGGLVEDRDRDDGKEEQKDSGGG